MTGENFQEPGAKCMGVVLDGRAQPSGIRKRGIDRTLLLILNAYHGVLGFKLPTVAGGQGW